MGAAVDDVRNAAERYLDELDKIGGAPDSAEVRAKAEERVGRHFLGAVVVQQRPTAAAKLETRDVIDGQQRLTTLQLLADATRQVVGEEGFNTEAMRLGWIVQNARAIGDDEFKLWPTRLDQDAFRAAMRGAETLRTSRIHALSGRTSSFGCRFTSGSRPPPTTASGLGGCMGWRRCCSRCFNSS